MTQKRLGQLAALLLSTAACSESAQDSLPPSNVIIYTAENVITIDADAPSAEAIALDDNMIVGVGSVKDLKSQFKGARIDETFAGDTLMPGLIDPHVHMTLGAMMYAQHFVPPWDMPQRDGWVEGLPDKESFLARAAEIEADAPEGPLMLYGFHNLIQGDLDRHDLDAISETRPIFVWHYSGHDFYLNSAAIEMAGLKPDLAEKFHGVDLDENGELTGRIYEDAGLALFPVLAPMLMAPDVIERGFNTYEILFKRAGVTTVAEMGYGIFTRQFEDANIAKYYDDTDAYRLYLVPEHRKFRDDFGDEAPAKINEMVSDDSRRAKVLPQVKLFTDAAFYSQTMRLNDPGYIGGQSKGTHGLWVTEEDELKGVMKSYWDAGLDIHIHSNGDAAQTATINAFASLPDGADGQRLIVEHAGLIRPEQLERMSGHGFGISAASHYVFYMGEDYELAIGDRIQHITPLRSAADSGMPITLHSDAPLAPPFPLIAAGAHVTRATRQGGVSTPSERLTKAQALSAITLDAAWSLGLEDQIGSLEAGKLADITVLASSPLETAPEKWGDIEVKGVLLDGKFHAAPAE